MGSLGLTQLSMKKSVEDPAGVCVPVGLLNVAAFSAPRQSYPHTVLVMACHPLWPFVPSRDFRMTLHSRSALSSFPSLFPPRGWQKPEHCSQSFVPQITRQHVWVGTPGHYGARSGSLSPSSILLHRPCEVLQEYACSPPSHSDLKDGALRRSW